MTSIATKSRRAVAKHPLAVDFMYLRDRYAAWVEDLAERYREQFRRGELHGFDNADAEAGDTTPEDAPEGRWEAYRAPIHRLTDEIQAEHVGTDAFAHVLIACSPSVQLIDADEIFGAARRVAAQCVALDLLRIARRRGWYVTRPGEEPSDEQLGVTRRSAA